MSRRGALLALGGAAAGGVGLAIGSAVLGAQPAAGTDGDPVLLGASNSATTATQIDSDGYGIYCVTSGDQYAGVWAVDNSPDGGYGIQGSSQHGVGIQGWAPYATGLLGSMVAGVVGESNGADGVIGLSTANKGVHGASAGFSGLAPVAPIGVFGETDASAGCGVYGASSGGSGTEGVTSADGQSGVSGRDVSTGGGQGVFGTSQHGPGVLGRLGTGSGLTGPGVPGAVVGDSSFDVSPGVVGLSSVAHGVYGETAAINQSGVWGQDTSAHGGNGVTGESVNGTGVFGQNAADGQRGIWGIDNSAGGGYGVFGETGTGIAVYGTLGAGQSGLLGSTVAAVVGDSSATDGVVGLSSGGHGVYGQSNATGANGVRGVAGASSDVVPGGTAGVFGDSNVSHGVFGGSNAANGVFGSTNADGFNGVQGDDGSLTGGTGVLGQSTNGVGMYGISESATEVGVKAQNTANGPQLLLGPSANTTLPATSSPGQFIVSSDGSLHYCETANEWTLLGSGATSPSIVTIDPVRVINTITGEGGITGPLVPGSTLHTSSVIPGTNGIPANATAILGNFAISGVGGALLNGYGTATIFPAGIATPGTANINSGAGCFAISNAVSVGFGTGTDAGKLTIVWGGGGPVPNAEAFLDVTGYII